jgi:hypothetical protein
MIYRRHSILILLGFCAMLLAFYSGFVYSDTSTSLRAAGGSGKALQSRMTVSATVASICSFQSASLMPQSGTQALRIGQGYSANCSVSQPVVLSSLSGSAHVSHASNAVISSGASQATTVVGGTPYVAEALHDRFLISF